MSPVSFSALSHAVHVIYAPPRDANTQHNRIFLSRIVINNIGLRLSDSETELRTHLVACSCSSIAPGPIMNPSRKAPAYLTFINDRFLQVGKRFANLDQRVNIDFNLVRRIGLRVSQEVR